MTITLGIADDQQLFLKALESLIRTFNGFSVVIEALDGSYFLEGLKKLSAPPDIALIDVNMPILNGIDTVRQLDKTYPLMKTVALSQNDDEETILSMLRAGCCAYLLKDIHPDELQMALTEISEKGYYNADLNIEYRRLLRRSLEEPPITFNPKERKFLQLACSDLTYKQIAGEMNMAERTIDGYREALFEKLNVHSRVGMTIEAIRRHLVQL